MTVKEMAKECKKIWRGVLKTGKAKPDTKYLNDCPACQYAADKCEDMSFDLKGTCGVCPLLKLWGNDFGGKKNDITPCQDSLSSPYRTYYLVERYGFTGGEDLLKISATMIIKYLEKTYKV